MLLDFAEYLSVVLTVLTLVANITMWNLLD